MSLPAPEPGLVIQYDYLWRHEAERGIEHARYPRPCAVVLARRRNAQGETEVVVAPFTHQAPRPDGRAIELPAPIRTALRLPKRTWVILQEVNVFSWPGYDLTRNADGDWSWGLLPRDFTETLRKALAAAARSGAMRQTRR